MAACFGKLTRLMSRKNSNSLLLSAQNSLSTINTSEEYAEKAEYPEIFDPSKEAEKTRKKHAWYDMIKQLPTVEEKQKEICDRWYYGYFCHKLAGHMTPYNNLPFIQHVTRTSFCEDSMPAHYAELDKQVEELLPKIKPQILLAAQLEFQKQRRLSNRPLSKSANETSRTLQAVSHVTRIILRNLSNRYAHILEAQVDVSPRVEAFWVVGGFPLSTKNKYYHIRQHRKAHQMSIDEHYRHLKQLAHEKERQFIHEHEAYKENLSKKEANKYFQYLGNKSICQVRCKDPLPVFQLENELPNTTHPRPKSWFMDPISMGSYPTTMRNGTNIPGYWCGDENEFGLIGFQSREHISFRDIHIDKKYDSEDEQRALHAHGILSSFGWLHAQASLQGFTTFHDVTYPLTTQMIITDGQKWSFYAYQLNTMVFYGDLVHSNAKENLCWGLKEMKLFEGIENGELTGVNDDVLRWILKFFMLKPEVRADVELKPYLSKQRYIANISEVDYREKIDTEYKHLMANRPRLIPQPEKYDWEKIYKIRYKTRPMDSPKRYWEQDITINKPKKEKLKEKFFTTH